jgi:acyl-[acyl-carrier-protein]-phospholipid O-acyltransferase/long-chain-fatty-acid--[acyl-carrier-protein] ligase
MHTGAEPIEASLLLTRRFAPVFWCQFVAVFSNNLYLNALIFLILFRWEAGSGVALIPLASAVLIAPSFVLSALGGEIADRYDMSWVAQCLRIAEIGIALVAAIGFLLGSLAILFAALVLFGVIVALFGPVKYGILPHLLAPAELPLGNALMEGANFIAILLGTIAGGLIVKFGNPFSMAAAMVLLSLSSWGVSLFIPKTGEAAPELGIHANVFTSTWSVLSDLRGDWRLAWCAVVMSWFWATGVVALALTPQLVKTVLGGTEIAVTICLAIFSIGIAVGSGLAARLAAGRVRLSLVIAAAAAIGVFAIDIGGVTSIPASVNATRAIVEVFGSALGIHFALALVGLSIAGGLYIVPLLAAVQLWAEATHRARVMAGVNVLTSAAMAGAALATAALQTLGVAPSTLFMLLGAASLVIAIVLARTMPASP